MAKQKWIVFYTWYDPNEWRHSNKVALIEAESKEECRKIVYNQSEPNYGEFYMDDCIEATKENIEKYKKELQRWL